MQDRLEQRNQAAGGGSPIGGFLESAQDRLTKSFLDQSEYFACAPPPPPTPANQYPPPLIILFHHLDNSEPFPTRTMPADVEIAHDSTVLASRNRKSSKQTEPWLQNHATQTMRSSLVNVGAKAKKKFLFTQLLSTLQHHTVPVTLVMSSSISTVSVVKRLLPRGKLASKVLNVTSSTA